MHGGSGDLSGKFGQTGIDGVYRPKPLDGHLEYFQDSTLTRMGVDAFVGRTIVIHAADDPVEVRLLPLQLGASRWRVAG